MDGWLDYDDPCAIYAMYNSRADTLVTEEKRGKEREAKQRNAQPMAVAGCLWLANCGRLAVAPKNPRKLPGQPPEAELYTVNTIRSCG